MTPWAVAALFLNTADVRDLWWDGGVLWAATSGGLEGWTMDGEPVDSDAAALPEAGLVAVGAYQGRLAVGTEDAGGATVAGLWRDRWSALPTGAGHPDGRVVAVLPDALVTSGGLLWPLGARVSGTASDAVMWNGALVVGTLQGQLDVVREGKIQTWDLPGPAVDLHVVDGAVRVACQVAAVVFDGQIHTLDVPATAAGPVWGTAAGDLVAASPGQTPEVVGHVPASVTAVEALPDGAWAVGTTDGVYHLAAGENRRWTAEGQICGAFVTGATSWQGHLAVSTFDHGACVQGDDGRWAPIPGLPTQMANDILAVREDLWIATGSGLVRWDGHTARVFGEAPWGAPSVVPGVNHTAVNGLANADRLWIVDVVGPTALDAKGRWRRYRRAVLGTSYQDVAACGSSAWFASEDAGVAWTDGTHWHQADSANGLPDDWIMAVACDSDGLGWAGTYQDGLWRWDGARWTELTGLQDRWVLALDWDGEHLWTGTMSGLFVWERGAWTAIPGLPSPEVHDIAVEGDRILVSTERGLAVLARPAVAVR